MEAVPEQYVNYCRQQVSGERTVLVALWNGEFAGYVTVLWQSAYPPFRTNDIPEINDFTVLMKFQRRGIGTRLLDAAEEAVFKRAPTAGIGVGLTQDFGPAQIMYIRRGYVPDGRGIAVVPDDTTHEMTRLKYGDTVTIDYDLALFLIKERPTRPTTLHVSE